MRSGCSGAGGENPLSNSDRTVVNWKTIHTDYPRRSPTQTCLGGFLGSAG